MPGSTAGKMPADTIDTANRTSDKSRRNFHDEKNGNEAETTNVSCDDWRSLFAVHRFALRSTRRYDTTEQGGVSPVRPATRR
jgi:hypothetical protein